MSGNAVTKHHALSGEAYDQQWRLIDDFILHHPGARHRRRMLFNLIRASHAADLIDVGCGNGELLALIGEQFPNLRLSGVDLSAEVIDRNRSRYPKIDFDVLDIEKQRLHRQYDLVVSSEVIEHLNDRAAALRFMGEMVRPGGHLLISAPAGRVFETERRWGHTSHPTRSELRDFAQTSGFQIKRLVNWGFPAYYALKYATNINTDWAMKNFGNGSYSNFQKLICRILYAANFLNLSDSAWGCQLLCYMRKPAQPD